MTESASEPDWRFVTFGLVVTGQGEWEFLPDLFRAIAATGRATFCSIFKAGQRKALLPKRVEQYGEKGKKIPAKDEAVALDIRRHVAQDNHFAIWIDDLETARRPTAQEEFDRLINALDTMIGHKPDLRGRCSVHFLVNMLEAYYFADTASVNEVLGTALTNHDGDCENIPHPKNELKRLAKAAGKAFAEKRDGAQIVPKLNLQKILEDPQSCKALRTLVAWCCEAVGEPRTEQFQLQDGVYWDITAPQLREQPVVERIQTLSDEEPYRPSEDSGGE